MQPALFTGKIMVTSHELRFQRPYSAFPDAAVIPKGTEVEYDQHNRMWWINDGDVEDKIVAHDAKYHGFAVAEADIEEWRGCYNCALHLQAVRENTSGPLASCGPCLQGKEYRNWKS